MKTFGHKIDNWLTEPAGQAFKYGKWRFWLPCLIVFTAMSAVLTALIFNQDGLQRWLLPVMLLTAAAVCWLSIGLLHYSDSDDRVLSIGVACLDSITLLFVAVHFSFLLWVQGHLTTLRSAEAKYDRDLVAFNAQAKEIQGGNERIAQSLADVANIEKQTERLRNDTAYWSRRNHVQSTPGLTFKADISTAKVELPPPPTKPPEASAAYLARWDSWVRFAGFGEVGLSLVTLIFIRTKSAAARPRRRQTRNLEPEPIRKAEDFPAELDLPDIRLKRNGNSQKRLPQSDIGRQSPASDLPHSATRRQSPASESFDRKAALKSLRAHLKEIAFHCPGYWFRADLIEGGVSIRMFKKINGIEETVASTRQSNRCLAAVDRARFRSMLLAELLRTGFPIEQGIAAAIMSTDVER